MEAHRMSKEANMPLFIARQFLVINDGLIVEVMNVGVPTGMPEEQASEYIEAQIAASTFVMGIAGTIVEIPTEVEVFKGDRTEDYDDTWGPIL
jgi:hypothetical protein